MTTDWGPEGYCIHCHFVLALDPTGRMVAHTSRGKDATTAYCAGTGERPAVLAPPEAEEAAFTDDPPVVTCATCGREVALTFHGVLASHNRPDRAWCHRSGRHPDAVLG